MLERIRRKAHPHTLLVGMQTGAATRENSVEISQKNKNRNTITSSYPFTGYLSEEIEINNSKRFMHPCVHYSISHNSQDMEVTQVPCYRWMDKEDVVCIIYNGILLSQKKRQDHPVCNKLDRAWGYDVKWNKPDKDKYAWFHSYVEDKHTQEWREQISGFQRGRGLGVEWKS